MTRPPIQRLAASSAPLRAHRKRPAGLHSVGVARQRCAPPPAKTRSPQTRADTHHEAVDGGTPGRPRHEPGDERTHGRPLGSPPARRGAPPPRAHPAPSLREPPGLPDEQSGSDANRQRAARCHGSGVPPAGRRYARDTTSGDESADRQREDARSSQRSTTSTRGGPDGTPARRAAHGRAEDDHALLTCESPVDMTVQPRRTFRGEALAADGRLPSRHVRTAGPHAGAVEAAQLERANSERTGSLNTSRSFPAASASFRRPRARTSQGMCGPAGRGAAAAPQRRPTMHARRPRLIAPARAEGRCRPGARSRRSRAGVRQG